MSVHANPFLVNGVGLFEISEPNTRKIIFSFQDFKTQQLRLQKGGLFPKMDLRVLTFALSIFLVFDCGEAITCEVCNGHTDAECNDPYMITQESGAKVRKAGAKFETDCESAQDTKGATMCRKIYQDVRGEIRIIRSCAWEKYKEKTNTCYKTVMEEYNTYVCTCDVDGCNGAGGIQVWAMLIAIISIITLGAFNH
jgi:hypothetical protein